MLTPQEVSTHSFSKASCGGYNMAMVDEFLDELTDDYTALYKENAALKAKMKVLVEKVEEYRATEDSMRATLLTAQRMADSIVQEAEAKRDEMLAQAETDAKMKIGQLQQRDGRQRGAPAPGPAGAGAVHSPPAGPSASKELQFLEQLPQLPVEPPRPSEAEADCHGQEIEEHVLAAFERSLPLRRQDAPGDGGACRGSGEEPAATGRMQPRSR